MISTDKLVYIHMPKTGGMWVANVLRTIAGGLKVPKVQRHSPFHMAPPELLKGRLTFGTIRDPWSWYTSLWQHLRNGVDGPPVLRAVGDGDESFAAFIQGITDLSHWPTIPHSIRSGWPWPPNLGGGYYTSLLRWTYGQTHQLHSGHFIQVDALIDQAQLREGLEQLLGMSIDATRFPPKNSRLDRPATAVKNPHTLYQHDEVDIVQQADGEVAFALGYTEPFAARRSAVVEFRRA